jgi:hypothetical protein
MASFSKLGLKSQVEVLHTTFIGLLHADKLDEAAALLGPVV